MAGINKVILMGNLTKDPEFKTTPSGVSVTSFSVAVGRRFSKPEDEAKADFFNVIAWRGTAEFIAKHFTKGKPIIVVGSLQTRNWTDQNGQKHYITEVVADECYFVGGGQSEAISPKSESKSMLGVIVDQAINNANFEELSTDEELPL